MFEKSLYDLIRGLRANKESERDYTLDSLKECRTEVKSQDLDIKATAILKLIYLEMFGHDMTWASFHTLEVMSSPKFRQKRVGYLAAVQSFRSDTDVLMLTTNLIKKDLNSPSVPEMSLAINGLSHIASPSLARDLAPDLVIKLSHSSPHVRKKAVLVLYKCFLQSPELLRTCWSRLRDCLSDDDTSVVSATVNVVCELARRNPKNYLPLAPQLFKLLTDGGNNWMTIKLIKLFATLTPLEPRLTRKLISPITALIRTTPAMSLLYECINGLIVGGLLDVIQDTKEGEELASVCVFKLRGFLAEGDSNLKYVGLLALTKLVNTHAHLVNRHQDVIMACIDDPDVSIRYRALELVVGMVDPESLPTVVGKLMHQLRPRKTGEQEFIETEGGELDEDNDLEDEVIDLRRGKKFKYTELELPDLYRQTVIERIIQICCQDMYTNIIDFEWYLDILMQLIRYAPISCAPDAQSGVNVDNQVAKDIGDEIGKELRNVAVRVRSVRAEAVRCAALLVSRDADIFPSAGRGRLRVLSAAAWIVGEYSNLLSSPSTTLDHLIQHSSRFLPPDIVAIYIQAAAKVYATLMGDDFVSWTHARKSSAILLTDRMIQFLEPLASAPNLDVQERAVEFLELFRLVKEGVVAQSSAINSAGEGCDPPLLLTQAVPSLFAGQELNPVAPQAQLKVPLPPGLHLSEPVNPDLPALISSAAGDSVSSDAEEEDEEFRRYYYDKPTTISNPKYPATLGIDSAAARMTMSLPYQRLAEEEYLDADIIARRRKERLERNRNDPFYIFNPGDVETITDADIESIPVMELKLDDLPSQSVGERTARLPKRRERVQVVVDEEIDSSGTGPEDIPRQKAQKRGRKKNLFQPHNSGLEGLSLVEDGASGNENDAEVTAARLEVERLRKEMEHAARRMVEKRHPAKDRRRKTKKGKPTLKNATDGAAKPKKKKAADAGDVIATVT